jgi:3-phosphoglycerate kinase
MMKTIDDVAVEGQRVLVRADLNVPMDGDQIADDGRIRPACRRWPHWSAVVPGLSSART